MVPQPTLNTDESGCKMNRIAQFPLEYILPRVGLGMPKLTLETPQGTFRVKTSSNRLECLKRNQKCVRCRRTGNVWILENSIRNAPRVGLNCFIADCPWCSMLRPQVPVGFETPHLNLYHKARNGQLLLMTQDHIMPRSRGGADHIDNLQTMCSQCNCFKGAMSPEEWAKVA
jgi:5-methylcytosine-specific restriction endonuclease McrA